MTIGKIVADIEYASARPAIDDLAADLLHAIEGRPAPVVAVALSKAVAAVMLDIEPAHRDGFLVRLFAAAKSTVEAADRRKGSDKNG